MARPTPSDPHAAETSPDLLPSLHAGDGDGGLDGDRAGRPTGLPPTAEGWADERLRERLWWAASVVYRRRWWIVAAGLVAAVAAVAISLSIANRYRAETRVLLPDSGGDFGGLLESVAPGASALLGTSSGGYTRYLAILSSRTMMEAVVDRFDLENDPEIREEEFPRTAALSRLAERTDFEVSIDYDYLEIQVLDEDPDRASQMANFYVEELNRRNIALTSQSAGEHRAFLEDRLGEAETAMDSALAEMQAFQERYGVIEIEAQAGALMTSLAEAQAAVAEAEARYRALQAQFGEDNPDVTSARAALESSRGQVARLTGGAEAFMPVPIGRLPEVSRRYALLMGEIKTQEEILRVLRPFYEQAVLTEREEASAVQVLDPALPPVKKAEPRRSLIVIGAGAAAGLLAALLVLVGAWVRQQGPEVTSRLRATA